MSVSLIKQSNFNLQEKKSATNEVMKQLLKHLFKDPLSISVHARYCEE